MVKRSRIVAFLLIVVVFAGLMGGTTNNILKDIKLGLDLQGGFEVLYEVAPIDKSQKINEDILNSTAKALDKRINVLGVSEPIIQIEGKDRVRVQLAGVTDQNKARELLSTEANLSFRDINDKELMDGSDLVEGGADQTFDQNGKPSVTLKLKSAEKFKDVTTKVLGNPLVIWLDYEDGDSYAAEAAKADPKFLSNPMVSNVLNTDTVSITGNFTVQEAKTLADLLNAGALPVKLTEVYSTSVGAQFGDEALKDTVFAGIVGVGLVFLFMLFYYRLPGLIAVITLSVFVYLNLLVLKGKMGKSEGEANAVYLSDDPETIRKKVMRAVSDGGPTEENQPKPEPIQNLFDLMKVVSSADTLAHFEDLYSKMQIRYGDFKKQLAEDMILATAPMRERIQDIAKDDAYLRQVAKHGALKARESAQKTIREVRSLIGFKSF